jgi:ankyrin repeat protein
MAKSSYRTFSWSKLLFADSIDSELRAVLLKKFESGTLKTEMLTSNDEYPRFAVRLNEKARVICTSIQSKDGIEGESRASLVVMEHNPNHKTFGELRSMQKGAAEEIITNISQVEYCEINLDGALVDNKVIIYNPEQQSVKSSIKFRFSTDNSGNSGNPEIFVCTGQPGTGKTLMALEVLQKAQDNGQQVAYIAQSRGLLNFVEKTVAGKVGSLTDSTTGEISEAGASVADDVVASMDKKASIQFLTPRELSANKTLRFFKQFCISTKEGDVTETFAAEALKRYSLGNAGKKDDDLDGLLEKYTNNTLVDFEYFKQWWGSKSPVKDKFKKQVKELGENINEKDLYIELLKHSIESIGKKTTAYLKLHKSENKDLPVIKNIFQEYAKYLNSQHKIDPSLDTCLPADGASSSADGASSSADEAGSSSDGAGSSSDGAGSSSDGAGSSSDEASSSADGASSSADGASSSADGAGFIVIVDEAQGLSSDEIKNILLSGATQVWFFADGAQSLLDPYPILQTAIFSLTNSQPTEVFNLTGSYRMPENIKEFSKILNNLKACTIGGRLDGGKDVVEEGVESIAYAASASEEAAGAPKTDKGIVQFITKTTPRFDDLVRKTADDIINWVVITFNETDKANAQKLFPGSIVLDAEEVGGLEFSNVIMYDPFGNNSIGPDSSLLEAAKKMNSGIVPQHCPKNSSKVGLVTNFNKIFVAATRATKGLYIYYPEIQTSKRAVKNAKETPYSILKKLTEHLLEEELSLGGGSKTFNIMDVVASIKERSENGQFTTAETLIKYVNIAFGKIKEDLNLIAKAKHELLASLHGTVSSYHCNPKQTEQISIALEKELQTTRDQMRDEMRDEAPQTSEHPATPEKFEAGDQRPKKPATSSGSKKKQKAKISEKHPTDPDTAEVAPKAANKASKEDIRLDLTLIVAVTQGKDEKVKDILSKHPGKANLTDGSGEPLLYIASSKGYTQIVKLLLDKLDKLDKYADKGDLNIALILACWAGHLDVVELLLQEGADKDDHSDMSTPLYIASSEGRTEIVKLLLEKKANPNIAGLKDFSPLFMACNEGYTQIVELLLKNGAYPNIANSQGTPLFMACHQGYTQIVELLLKNRANPNTAVDNMTPLYNAVANGHHDIVKLLLASGANLNINNSHTLLALAHEKGHHTVTDILLPYVGRTLSPQTTTQEEVSPGAHGGDECVEKDSVDITGDIAWVNE